MLEFKTSLLIFSPETVKATTNKPKSNKINEEMITIVDINNTFNFFQQKSSTSIGGEMNAVLSPFSVGVQTSAEIEELSLRAPRPVATTE
ncbi:hypothetical protein [Lysinibacillus sp. NPDC092081]|uniref:hypothetical protein n=1 Tax=Lysinibacillus sp. NPDC092081 TaxID=3364131 RepID=UPI003803ADE6